MREGWARIGNRHLERYGFEPTLDHRTLEAQGIEREPTIHMGKSATAIEREGKPSELGDVNRQIEAENERRVIDLAAERAKREQYAAAKGLVDDIGPDRPRDTAAEFERAQQEAFANACGRRDEISPSETPREVVEGVKHGRGADGPAPTTTPTTEPQRAPEAAKSVGEAYRQWQAASERDQGNSSTATLVRPAAEETLEKTASITSQIIGAIAERFTSFIVAIADFIAPAPALEGSSRAERACGRRSARMGCHGRAAAGEGRTAARDFAANRP